MHGCDDVLPMVGKWVTLKSLDKVKGKSVI